MTVCALRFSSVICVGVDGDDGDDATIDPRGCVCRYISKVNRLSPPMGGREGGNWRGTQNTHLHIICHDGEQSFQLDSQMLFDDPRNESSCNSKPFLCF